MDILVLFYLLGNIATYLYFWDLCSEAGNWRLRRDWHFAFELSLTSWFGFLMVWAARRFRD